MYLWFIHYLLIMTYLVSFRRSVGHVNRRYTDHLQVPYFVNDRFTEEYSGSNLKTVERNVEDDYISNLRNNCWKEKQHSKSCHGEEVCLWHTILVSDGCFMCDIHPSCLCGYCLLTRRHWWQPGNGTSAMGIVQLCFVKVILYYFWK